MSPLDQPYTTAVRARPAINSLAIFGATLFLSALLLFSIQPMFTKMVLPTLGGSPSVWSVALVFFQAMLLLGYLYAHLLTRYCSIRLAAGIHAAVLAAAFIVLPIHLAPDWHTPPTEGASFWLLGLFFVSVGLPFFAVSANGPLLQAWFGRTDHAQARDPYFLYGASNLGSFAGLLLYPVVFEPLLTLNHQSAAWTGGFAALALMIMVCAVVAVRMMAPSSGFASREAMAAPTRWSDRLSWIGLSFVPSGLLVAVTAHLSTDVASAPFMWVVPLALFLLTFVLVFRDKPPIPHSTMLLLQPWTIAAGIVFMALSAHAPFGLMLGMPLVMFFVSTMACHGELYRLRPAVGQLTEFYLWMSFGGVLGGAFASLAAPFLFSNIYEYPLLIVAALLCRPHVRTLPLRAWLPTAVAFAMVAAVVTFFPALGLLDTASRAAAFVMPAIVLTALAAAPFSSRPGIQIGLTALALTLYFTAINATTVETDRSFFGVNKTIESADGHFRILQHGSTVHGAERIRNADGTAYAGPPIPTTYYYFGGPISQGVTAVREAKGGVLAHVAAVGLGTGSLACHRKPGEAWTFFEIDPVVADIARDPKKFRFLSDCAPDAPIVLGDARLTLAHVDQPQDLIVLDAFSSDSIPVHLLTREAFAIYAGKLAPQGAMVVHISNRNMDLRSIVARVAGETGMVAWFKFDDAIKSTDPDMRAPAIVVAVARQDGDLGAITTDPTWQKLTPDPAVALWTDDYSNIIAAIWQKFVR